METGFDTTLLNLNPEGWIEGVTTERSWKMLYGMDVCTQRQVGPSPVSYKRAEGGQCLKVAGLDPVTVEVSAVPPEVALTCKALTFKHC